MDNTIDKKRLLIGAFVKGYLEAELLGIFVFLFFWAVSKAFGLFGNIMFGFVGIATVFAVVADYGLKQGDKAYKKVHLHGAEPCRNFGLAIGAVASIPCWVSLLLLALSKAGILFNFLPAYKIINAFFFPIIDIVAHTADVNEMHPACFGLFAVLPFFFILSGWLSFRWGYDQVDLKTKVLYKNKEK
ncbi:MAG: hypothetical protein IKP95_08185 [Ruminococcus sp.]|nr:hypothetical protein [Ruminococcus sp.]